MSLRSQLGAARRGVLSSLHRRIAPSSKLRGPIVSFTFDDFPRSAYLTGGRILEEFGVRGTYYTAPALMNTSNELGDHFCADDLSSLLAKGHELGNHTFSHVSCRSLSRDAFQADIDKGRETLRQLTGQAPVNFSYPFGDITLGTKADISPKLASARGIFPGINDPADLNLLRANRVYGDADQLESAQAMIEENSRRNGWLIFYTHDVRPDPSPYGCTPALFEALVAKTAAEKNKILTVASALAQFGN